MFNKKLGFTLLLSVCLPFVSSAEKITVMPREFAFIKVLDNPIVIDNGKVYKGACRTSIGSGMRIEIPTDKPLKIQVLGGDDITITCKGIKGITVETD